MIPNRCSMKCRLHGAGARGRAGFCLTPVVRLLAPFAFLLFIFHACGPSVKLSRLEKEGAAAGLRLPPDMPSSLPTLDTGLVAPRGDTLRVTGLNGEELLIMRAELDEESGEMVAVDRIDAAVVTARFRNIAERNGSIRLEFQVTVPEYMRDSDWQLRLYPELNVQGESRRLDEVIITGENYRRAQLRGYEQYRRFLSRIITDTLDLIDMRSLEVFIARNIPEVYAFRSDSSYVSDEEFESSFGVTSRQAAEHYTLGHLVRRNRRLIGLRDSRWRKYVKAPIVTEGVRLDTVMRGGEGEFIYNYVQVIPAKAGIRKVDVALSGGIFREDKRLYDIPLSEPLTFYVSSLSSLADGTEKYLTRIISRNVEANMNCHIDFSVGSSRIETGLGGNASEIGRIESTLRALLTDDSFVMDSIMIIASASPEGSLKSNLALSFSRARSVSEFFSARVDRLKDSLRREAGVFMSLGPDPEDGGHGLRLPEIVFSSKSGGENWFELDRLVAADSLLSEDDKRVYLELAGEADLDRRERRMAALEGYSRIREELYPQLRSVNFNFFLHRRGMLKDTVHTTTLDSTYMEGVRLLREHEYEQALDSLLSYRDYNTAVAFVALDRNASALDILLECPRTASVNYMLAMVYSRQGNDRDAVECLIAACGQDPSFRHRANLDPEVSELVRRYEIDEML